MSYIHLSCGKDYKLAMAITDGSLVEIIINQTILSQQVLNRWDYEITDHIGTVTLVQLLEGYWNHIKATLRAVAPSGFGNIFVSIKGRELNNPNGDYAEYDVPVGERAGTRAAGGDLLPPYIAASARLVVGTRTTRPGQKRFSYLTEADQVSGILGTSVTTPLTAHLNVMVAEMVLGAPAALETLQPIIAKREPGGFVSAFQPISGFLVSPNMSSQNTRKFGRGS